MDAIPFQPIILSGGSGIRLWPLSRKNHPKQLNELLGSKTPLQATSDRLSALPEALRPIVLASFAHRFTVQDQLSSSVTLVLEKSALGTAFACAIGALEAARLAPNTVVAILPADQFISDEAAFAEALQLAVQGASKGRIVTLGVLPSSNASGYGYIQRADQEPISEIVQFIEKPNPELASALIAGNDCLWNMGAFIFQAESLLAELEVLCPEMLASARSMHAAITEDLGFRVLPDLSEVNFDPLPFDKAVMEKTKLGSVVEYKGHWNDLGTWKALWEVGNKDENENHIRGEVYTLGCKGNIFWAEGRAVAALGLEDLVIAETSDCIFIGRKDQDQELRQLVDLVASKRPLLGVDHAVVRRPWGHYETLQQGHRFQVKRILVKPGGILSLQKHYHRSEHWVVISGTAKVEVDEKTSMLAEGESVYIPLGAVHRLSNPGLIDLQIIEVQTGAYLGEDDIVRLADSYGRVEESVK